MRFCPPNKPSSSTDDWAKRQGENRDLKTRKGRRMSTTRGRQEKPGTRNEAKRQAGSQGNETTLKGRKTEERPRSPYQRGGGEERSRHPFAECAGQSIAGAAESNRRVENRVLS
ncbi:hypothetical protein THAOC_31192 [Thalassiosira oceanica]|uniref:Uncharacterized protein n=1 Tax=Thalassiosira oceanica TaxID=159749 RepID=K0RC77_THAOC|nr:hypothetical protein THAOC_31192 [Thalassiosira oceanica]|eukprot:EJK49884.1 hypothetical protein THAOC_31192 [Thalassiosira oceanica]